MITEFRLMTIHDDAGEMLACRSMSRRLGNAGKMLGTIDIWMSRAMRSSLSMRSLAESLVPSATAWAATTWATAATRTAIASCIR